MGDDPQATEQAPEAAPARPHLHIWQKPNWMGPIIQTVGLIVVTVITVTAAVRRNDTPSVKGEQIDRSGVTVELVSGTVVITCGTAAEVPVTLIRKDSKPVTTAVCSPQPVVLP